MCDIYNRLWFMSDTFTIIIIKNSVQNNIRIENIDSICSDCVARWKVTSILVRIVVNVSVLDHHGIFPLFADCLIHRRHYFRTSYINCYLHVSSPLWWNENALAPWRLVMTDIYQYTRTSSLTRCVYINLCVGRRIYLARHPSYSMQP